MKESFLNKFFTDLSSKIIPDAKLNDQLYQIKENLIRVSQNNKKVIIVGNGASSSIASHVSIDLTKGAGVRCVTFNEPNLLTCFGNDFGYEYWVEKAIQYYGDKDDVLIAVSSSGQSENILNGCHAARKKGFDSIITLSGFNPDNPLRKLGDVNLWIHSENYNIIENVHQIWLLAVVELIIFESANK
ncbi:MAG: SIS domain-containing protein [Candidatus Marinimicrobia bacterium]|jgi:D-sedoheptulose 7-phosphate isomerase|nr:SIS domain-containing protein [Candidatus Neomarinimicrobiota bacterium]MBT3633455.1 SIS domain-containing protein [Candidatus Neomarinimicrobiota bacterium]MBT3681598.1 SIS domain-containing protein [Candidatus Neomarinimicrobiota bacterium]MBT3758435.1 SIS domain-containing protein [Candidatus Neomarinimicrobiota bacterium]MBT3894911.1 SIS domain-containing protein [Candidatus Neomarinimicrobiota bacterium]